MSVTFLSLLSASLGGNVELLTLCFAGALLSHLGHWSGTISAAMSNGIYKLFFPALAFGAVLDTVHSNFRSVDASSADVWVPLSASVLLSLAACIMAYPVVQVIGRDKDDLVRRAMFMCLVLGNSNSMPLLIMQSLCDNYGPFRSIPKCVTKSTTYSTFFILPVTVLTWSFVFPYMLHTLDESESNALLSPANSNPPQKKHTWLKGVKDSVLCPPTVTVFLASVIAFLPRLPGMFLNDDGAFHSLLQSTNLVGTVAVPMSSIIVGAELYESLTENEATLVPSKSFGTRAIVVISFVRFVIYPFVGRILHRLFGLNISLAPLLSTFVLTEWTVTSANNTIIMSSIIAEMLPAGGERLRRDVANCLFLQYLVSPILVTADIALALNMIQE